MGPYFLLFLPYVFHSFIPPFVFAWLLFPPSFLSSFAQFFLFPFNFFPQLFFMSFFPPSSGLLVSFSLPNFLHLLLFPFFYCVLALFSFLASFLMFLSLMSLVNSRQKEDVRFDPESSIYFICPCWGQFAGHSVFKAGSVSSHLGPVKSIIVHDTATQSRFNLSLFCRAEEAEVGQMLSWFWVSGGDSGCIITAGGSGRRSVVC